MHSMVKISRSFRAKMILLFGISMSCSASITYLLFKSLQFYYHTSVQHEDLMAQIRILIGNFGDFNLFSFYLFYYLSSFSFYLLNLILSTLMKFQTEFVISRAVTLIIKCISHQMMNLEISL